MAAKKKRQGETKRCSRCEAFKPLDEFGRNAAMADGRAAYCRPCKRQADRGQALPEKSPSPKPAPLAKAKKQPGPKRRGRPSTITPALIEQLASVLRRGHTRRAAARKCGVLEDTLASWMKRGAEEESGPTADLHRAVIEAEGEGEFSLLELVREGAEIDAQQARWILERRYSTGAETWVRKEHVDVHSGPEMPEVSVVRELLFTRLRGLGLGGAAPAPDAAGGEGPAPGGRAAPDEPPPPPPPAGAAG